MTMTDAFVVPYVGTWIEINRVGFNAKRELVVPYVGTWIEMYSSVLMRFSSRKSFPTWERG